MTIEELKQHCVRQIAEFERVKEIMSVTLNDYKRYEEHKIVLSLIEAWDKVEADILGLDGYYDDAFWEGVYTVSKIIGKHLAEVKNE